MSGVIRLRPNRILLTSEEVHKSLHLPRPPPSTSPAALAWDHNITMRRQRASREHYAETLDLYSSPRKTSRSTGGDSGGPQVHSDGSSPSSSPPSSSLAVRTGDRSEGGEEQEQGAGPPTAAAVAAPPSPPQEWESAGSTEPSTPSPVSTQDTERHVEFIDVEYLDDIELGLPAFDGAYPDNDITPPSIRRLVERESSPVAGLSPQHVVSRRRLARFRDRSGGRERERIEVFIAGNETEGKESNPEASVE